nr:uncharacterized protein LOC123765480 [Procambarus clarkii]XP_045610048.1 uncharacterized protein LOC123765480 [Procambarus clarkii]
MFVVGTIFVLLIFFMFVSLMHDLQTQDALLLNASLSSNMSQFLANDLANDWLVAPVLTSVSGSENNSLVNHTVTEPDWALVLGTFSHLRDENFEEYLVANGVPYLVRKMVAQSRPTVTVERVYQDDYEYYDLETHYPDTDVEQVEEDSGRVYQMVITSSTWFKTLEERFRPGYTAVKEDYDGALSKNTFWFASESTLVHRKIKNQYTANVVRSFHQDGFTMTIVNMKTGMRARRHFLREA